MLRLYKCKHCGNIVIMAYDGGGQMSCCGEPMELIEANTVDAAQEKHVPVATVEGNTVTVKVGSVEHPMTEVHYIGSIMLECTGSLQTRFLKYTDKPEATFAIAEGEKPVAVYEYCTLHGLWEAEL